MKNKRFGIRKKINKKVNIDEIFPRSVINTLEKLDLNQQVNFTFFVFVLQAEICFYFKSQLYEERKFCC